MVFAPHLSSMRSFWLTLMSNTFGWVLNLGRSGLSVFDDLSFLIANCNCAAVRESLSVDSTGVNQLGWRIGRPNQRREGES